MISKRVYNHVKCVLSEHQHGFLPGRSCETNLSVLLHEARLAFNEARQMDIVYTDFSKAFDKVKHKFLVYKLSKYGIQNTLLDWFSSYLIGRTQVVTVKGCRSNSVSVSSGVPQGSQLGPLCFILYLNDIFKNFESKSLGFADDLKLYKVIRNHTDSLSLQDDIDLLSEWSEKWKMSLNYAKCVVLRLSLKRLPIDTVYKIGSHELELVNSYSDLGVILDTKLTFTPHVTSIISDSRRLLGMLKRFGKGLSTAALIAVYTAFVRTKLEYASIVWNSIGKVNSDKLEAVQRNFIRYLCYVQNVIFDDISYNDLCVKFNLPTLEKRRNYFDLVFLHKSVNAIFDCQPIFNLHIRSRSTRQIRTFNEPGGRVKFTQHSLFNRIPRLYNTFYQTLPIFNISASSFKRKAKRVCF